MPYKDPTSAEARASQRKQAARYYEKHREKAISAVLRSRKKNPASYLRAQNKFKGTHPDYFHRKNAEYYAAHKDERRAIRKWLYKQNPQKERDYERAYYARNREDILQKQKTSKKRKEYFRNYYRELKKRVIAAYGGECACCGEGYFEFLTIDHIHGNGRKHRAEHKGGGFYSNLEKQGFPQEGLRLLCMNCNFALGKYGHCPHQPKTH